MSFAPLPVTAAWHHRGARSGFEVVFFQACGDGCGIAGWTTAIEDGATGAVEYVIQVDALYRFKIDRMASDLGFMRAVALPGSTR